MILPTTFAAALSLLAISVLCLASWPSLQKLAGRWRFELFYCDFSIGVAIFAALAAFTLGSLNSGELTFEDNLLIASRHAIAYGIASGIVFNLSNILLLGAIQVCGMTSSYPIAFGLAMAVGSLESWFLRPGENVIFLFSAAILALIAVVSIAYAQWVHVDTITEIKAPLRPDPRSSRAPRPPSVISGIVLSAVSGILMVVYSRLSESATTGETALGAYSAALLFAGGVLASTFLYLPFFLTFPVQGRAAPLMDYFKGTAREHALGLIAGMVWMGGILAAYTGASGGAGSPVIRYVLLELVPLGAAVWGLLVWKEFAGASIRVRMLLLSALVLYAAGIALAALASVFSK